MLKLLRENRNYFALYLLLTAASFCLLLLLKRGDEVLFFNKFYGEKLNFFFIWTNRLGEELIAVCIALILLWFKPVKDFAGFVVSALIVSLLVFFFKNYLFPDIDRPKEVFGYVLKFVEGIYINSHNSFPSGHTAAAFTYFTYVSLLVKNNFAKMGFLFLAILAGLSRIYLAQHFLIDVIAGSVLGVFIAIVVYLFFQIVAMRGNSTFWNKPFFRQ